MTAILPTPRARRVRTLVGRTLLPTAVAITSACSAAAPATSTSVPARPVPSASGTTTPVAASTAARDRIAATSDEVVGRTNAERRANGLPSLTRSVNLMSAARLQAEQMASARDMSHDLPKAAYPTLKSRLGAVSYLWRAIAENIAEGQSGAAAVVASWMSSTGHRANILSPAYTETGVGLAYSRDGRPYFAQVFARPR